MGLLVGGWERVWMSDGDEQSDLEHTHHMVPPPLHTYPHHTGQGASSLRGSFAHLGGFPTAGWLSILPQGGRKSMIDLMIQKKYSVSFISTECMKILKLVGNNIR